MKRSCVVWLGLISGCLDAPFAPEDVAPQARVIVSWDPLACGDPHRVAIELEDDDGVRASTSTWCTTGAVTLDVPRFGLYYGRIYAWAAGETRGEQQMQLAVDQPVMRWIVPTPQ